MSNEVERKIRVFCNKGKMDIKNLRIIEDKNGYIADDGRMSMMFDEKGKPTSLPMNRTYSNMGPKFGKWLSIIYLAVIIGLILFFAIGVLIDKFFK